MASVPHESQAHDPRFPTEAEIAHLKTAHGNRLGLIELDLDGETIVYVVKPASRDVLAASTKVADKDVLKGVDVMVQNTVVWGDVTRFADTRVFMALGREVETFNAPAAAKLKNL